MRSLRLMPLILVLSLACFGGEAPTEQSPDATPAEEDMESTRSQLPLPSQLRLMLLPRDQLDAVPEINTFEELPINTLGGAGDEFSVAGDFLADNLREAGWTSGVSQYFQDGTAFAGGSIVGVEFKVTAYEDKYGAQRALKLIQDALLTDFEGFDEVTFEPFELEDLGDVAWGLTRYSVRNGPDYEDNFTNHWVIFSIDGIVAHVQVSRFDDQSSEDVAVALARAWEGRVRAVLAGDLDTAPEIPGLTPAEVLALSRQAMAGMETLHVSALRRVSTNGDEVSTRLE